MTDCLTSEELECSAVAVGHLINKHGYDALSSRHGTVVELSALRTKLALLAAEVKSMEGRPNGLDT